jgi:hypothetical protein
MQVLMHGLCVEGLKLDLKTKNGLFLLNVIWNTIRIGRGTTHKLEGLPARLGENNLDTSVLFIFTLSLHLHSQ